MARESTADRSAWPPTTRWCHASAWTNSSRRWSTASANSTASVPRKTRITRRWPASRHAARIKDMLEDARAKGAIVIPCGEVGPGRRLPLHVVTNCTPDMTLMREEIFGPVLPVVPYDTHEQAIEMVQRQGAPAGLVLLQP
ncbi:aldehyde dehydrogenase family protein [Cupriavidus basilensis]